MSAHSTTLALSVRQPWAWLIVNRWKPVENRTWPTKVRGWVAIHASQKIDRAGYEWVRSEFPHIEMPPVAALECGGLVGQALLEDCVSDYYSRWFRGPYGFVFADAMSLPFVPCRGQLGFFRPVLG